MSPMVVIAMLAGPPKLPPLPGKDAPASEPPGGAAAKPSAPTKPAPAKPSAPTTPPSKLPSKPTIAPAAPTPGAPAAVPPGSAAIPEAGPAATDVPTIPDAKGEPPQPDATAPPPKPVREGPGAAPRMDGKPLPGDDDDDDDRRRLPPPARPPSNGTDLFIGAGVMFGVALAEQIAGHIVVKRRCIDPVAKHALLTDTPEGAEEFGDAIVRCLPGVVPAVALRINSDLLLLGTIGMLAAGAIMRGQQKAYDDAFAQKRQRNIKALRGAGVGLVAGGVITWLTMGPTSWGLLSRCGTAKCATRARAMSFITRDVGALLAASGAAMLGFATAYRRKHDEFSRERAIMFAPQLGRNMAGLGLSGRF